MYSLYIPKYKGKKASGSILPKELSRFMKCTNYSYDLLVSPGYLSTRSGTINQFLAKMDTEFVAAWIRKVGVGLFHGMNGYSPIVRGSSTSILDEHSIVLAGCGGLEEIAVDPAKKNDHRKMIFFFDRKDWNITIKLDSGNMDAFLDEIVVKAVLIGSSNFSWSTYYDAGGKTPQQGEADLLMFVDNDYKEAVIDEIKGCRGEIIDELEGGQYPEEPQMVLFESIAGGKRPEKFFEDILRNFLTHSLN